MTNNQGGAEIDITGLQAAGFRYSQAGGIHDFQKRAVPDAQIRVYVRRKQQPLHLFLTEKFRQPRMLLRRVYVLGRMLLDMTVEHEKAEEAAGGANRARN